MQVRVQVAECKCKCRCEGECRCEGVSAGARGRVQMQGGGSRRVQQARIHCSVLVLEGVAGGGATQGCVGEGEVTPHCDLLVVWWCFVVGRYADAFGL